MLGKSSIFFKYLEINTRIINKEETYIYNKKLESERIKSDWNQRFDTLAEPIVILTWFSKVYLCDYAIIRDTHEVGLR